ncbi:YebC/PmpR family DNA-binding transcriptional regulator [Ferrimicrobium acidiphilum]|jgi:YebC/PmpR family DNA-binding regulatory protein|uniref:Probable transcriptional regulatory protein FEAC_02710 n=1 Tax=Ferrimicrobium acidiphilum DSM 19497 TaxID=1121877 RepID=A0A0D8FY58_9ACTN|nr:YebC/PmpR family DNA-binding transcriptional regulator [Ferrimicrobium acidiphilum]KJE77899.1 putative transcriptional regulatory protein [Ferrimicrobium acidiphilum DSM 19497]
MSGHSKWATIKHKKGAQDKARGKLFAKLIRQIEVAAREGGGDQGSNANLRGMVQKARDNSVPVATIDRAIKRGTGELEGVRYEAITYEGYGPGGVAVMVECLSDNRNRTGADVRSAFSKSGGSLAEPGAVSWQFSRKVVIVVAGDVPEEELMLAVLNAGGEDLTRVDEDWQITAPPNTLTELKSALEGEGYTIRSAEVELVPQSTLAIDDAGEARKVLRLVDALEDLDDVQNVIANFDIPDEFFEELDD